MKNVALTLRLGCTPIGNDCRGIQPGSCGKLHRQRFVRYNLAIGYRNDLLSTRGVSLLDVFCVAPCVQQNRYFYKRNTPKKLE